MEATEIDSDALLQAVKVDRPEVEKIDNFRSFRPSYNFFPAKLTLTFCDGKFVDEVLKTSKRRDSLEVEKEVLEALHEIGLPVPQTRSSIFRISQHETACWGILLEVLDGEPLEWLGIDNLHSADTSCNLTIAGVEKLHQLTDKVLQHRISATIPKRHMADEFELIKSGGGPWLSEVFFRAALDSIESIIPQLAVPLVFTNGDYNPLNFISRDGIVTGWIDFEHACFEDPHIGFAKFVLWADDSFGWATGARAGLVERYIFNNNIRPRDFYCRVVLRGLYYIHLRSVIDPPLYMKSIVESYTEKLRNTK